PNGSGSRVTVIEKGSTGAKNLWANWSIKTYSIALVYQLADGTIRTSYSNYTYGIGATLPSTIEGYDFDGWFTNSSFTGTPVTEISATDSGNKKFWANTTPKTYTITLHIDGGTIADGKNVTSYTYGTGATLPTKADIMKYGFNFGGWFTNEECSGSIATQISITDTGNKEFWAKWMEKRNEISGKIGKYGAPYRVGDIIFNDGSAVPYEELTESQKAAAIALIFYEGKDCNNEGNTNTRTLGIGLQNSQGEEQKVYSWQISSADGTNKRIDSMACTPDRGGSNSASKATFTGVCDGSYNWAELCNAVSDEEISGNYPMWEWINAYAGNNQITGDYASGWYIPSIAELCMIYRVKSIVNAGIEKAGGTKIADDYYWSSSTLPLESYAYRLHFDPIIGIANGTTDRECSVCAIREF
ncbi:MAG: InlB B-repeat-containing protein, partial [Treponema sp.]|nr:InlB B-repeat-containing protein [Treponema sp.]